MLSKAHISGNSFLGDEPCSCSPLPASPGWMETCACLLFLRSWGASLAARLGAVPVTAVASVTFPIPGVGWMHVEIQEFCLPALFLSVCRSEVCLKSFSIRRITVFVLIGFSVKKAQKMECALGLHVSYLLHFL